MRRLALGVLLAAGCVFGQPSKDAPAFEAAVVKANRSGHNGIGGRGICMSGGRVMVTNVPLSVVMEQVYEVKGFQLWDRPAWLDSERFDIEAKAGSLVKYGECLQMMQALLAERFGLRVRRETKQLPVYRLVVAKNGPRGMRRVAAGEPLGIRTFSTTDGQLDTRGNTMAQFAGMLTYAKDLESLVVDATGLEGAYEFKLEWTPDSRAADVTARPSLFAALQEQLGLKLEAARGPVEVLVIEHIERVRREQ